MPELLLKNLRLTAASALLCLVIGFVGGSIPLMAYRLYAGSGPHRGTSGGFTYSFREPSASKLAPLYEFRQSLVSFCCWAGVAAAQGTFIVQHLGKPGGTSKDTSEDQS